MNIQELLSVEFQLILKILVMARVEALAPSKLLTRLLVKKTLVDFPMSLLGA